MLKFKNLSKSENLPKINAKKIGSGFLTLDARIIFNYLWLVFTKTLIL